MLPGPVHHIHQGPRVSAEALAATDIVQTIKGQAFAEAAREAINRAESYLDYAEGRGPEVNDECSLELLIFAASLIRAGGVTNITELEAAVQRVTNRVDARRRRRSPE